MSFRNKAFAAVRWTTLAAVSRAVLQIVQVAVLARLLAPAEYGLMSIVTVVVAFGVTLGDLGLSSALVQRESITPEQRSSLFWLNLFVSVSLALGLAACAPLIALAYGSAQLVPLIAIGAITLVIQASTQQLWAVAEKELRFRPVALIEITAGLCGFVAALAAALSGLGVFALVLSPLVSALVCASLSWPILSRGWRPSRHFRYADVRSFLRFGGTTVVSGLIGQLNLALDVLIGGRMLGAAALGVFSVPRNLALQLQFIVNPIVTRVGFPLIAQVQKDTARVRHIYLSTMNMTASVNAPLYLGIAFFAPEITSLLLGKGWEAAGSLLRILAVWGALRSTVNPVGGLLLGVGRPDLHLKWNVSLLLVSVPTLLAGCRYGAAGLASASLLLAVLSVIAGWYVLVRPTCGATFTDYALVIVRPFLLALISIGLAHALASMTTGPVIRLAWGMVLSIPVYLLLSMVLNREWALALRDLAGLGKPSAV